MVLKIAFKPRLIGQCLLRQERQLLNYLEKRSEYMPLAEVERHVKRFCPKEEFRVLVINVAKNPFLELCWKPTVPVSRLDFDREDMLFLEGSRLLDREGYCAWGEIRDLMRAERGTKPEIWTRFTPRGADAVIWRDTPSESVGSFHIQPAA